MQRAFSLSRENAVSALYTLLFSNFDVGLQRSLYRCLAVSKTPSDTTSFGVALQAHGFDHPPFRFLGFMNPCSPFASPYVYLCGDHDDTLHTYEHIIQILQYVVVPSKQKHSDFLGYC